MQKLIKQQLSGETHKKNTPLNLKLQPPPLHGNWTFYGRPDEIPILLLSSNTLPEQQIFSTVQWIRTASVQGINWRQSWGWVINPPTVAPTEWYLTVYVSLTAGICHLRKKFQCLGGSARGEGGRKGGGSRMQLEKRKDRKKKLNLAPEKRSNFPPPGMSVASFPFLG